MVFVESMHTIAVTLLSFSVAIAGQDTRTDDGIAVGRALLDRFVQAQSGVAQMTADYVQHRSTPLTKKPLTSKGTLALRREPGCVVFHVREPRAAVIRLDLQHHEVWQPDKNRLERFVLPSGEMPRMLFDALAPTKTSMEQGFTLARSDPVAGAPTQRRLTLVPKDAKARRVAAKVTVTIDAEGPKLCAFGYEDPRGGDVRVELSALKVAATADDKLFALDVPKDALVVVQRVPEAKDAKPASEPVRDKR